MLLFIANKLYEDTQRISYYFLMIISEKNGYISAAPHQLKNKQLLSYEIQALCLTQG